MTGRKPPRILIVDDEPANIHVLAEALGPSYEAHFATDGERALARAQELAPDLVLLDVVMPGLSGFEVLRRLKSDDRARSIPVIFVTAMSDVEDEEKGFELGAVDYIAKPISPPIVRARVRTHLELKHQRDLLEAKAALDGLTGIPNRRRFDERLSACFIAAGEGPLSVMLMDVDFFKQFNDEYGHAGGDECLRRVAAVLPEIFRRPQDLPARYGGEEFVVLMPGTDAVGAVGRAEQLLDAIRALAIPHRGSRIAGHVTLSLGAVTTRPTPSDSPSALLEVADRLLYEAKETGRNRCVHLEIETGAKQVVLARKAKGDES